jgi:hypothetical protein
MRENSPDDEVLQQALVQALSHLHKLLKDALGAGRRDCRRRAANVSVGWDVPEQGFSTQTK